jgi:hypothetical protein
LCKSDPAVILAEGVRDESKEVSVVLAWSGDVLKLTVDGGPEQKVKAPVGPGAVGLLLASHAHAAVTRFAVKGEETHIGQPWLYTEGLLDAAQNLADWEERQDASFRFGVGAVCKSEKARAKWSFEGSGFVLWAPKGPEYRGADLLVDGEPAGSVDFHAEAPVNAAPVFSKTDLTRGPHALVVIPQGAGMPLDSLDVIY